MKADNLDEVMYANLKAEFNDYKKTLRRSINEAKQLYYKRTFELYRNDSKQTWSVIKHTLQKNVRCPDSTNFVLNNRMITNLDEIANEFNKYFVNIGRSLNDRIQAVTTSDDYLLQHNKPETTFNFVSVNEVYIDNVINKLKIRISSGTQTFSNISARIWNSLVVNIDINVSLTKFKESLKQYLLSNVLVIKYTK